MKKRNDWHLLTAKDTLSALKSDMYRGLSDKDVKRRRNRFGINSVWQIQKISAAKAMSDSVFDMATVLLIISVIAAALFEKNTEAVAVSLILIISGIIRAVIYIKAARIFEKNAEGQIPSVSVIRDGRLRLVTASDIVIGDIVFLEAGCTVPCDGRVVAGEDSIVSENGITSNSEYVHKFETVISTDAEYGEVPCELRSNMVFAGSVVLAGNLRIAATACGENTLVCMKQGGIVIEPDDKPEIIEKIRSWCHFSGLATLVIAVVLSVLSLFISNGPTLPDVFIDGLAIAVAAMSEYLSVIAYIIIAISVKKCASVGNTVIRKPACMEKLAAVKQLVFCGDSFFKQGNEYICSCFLNGKVCKIAEGEPYPDGLGGLISYMTAAVPQHSKGISAASSVHETRNDKDELIAASVRLYSEKSNVPLHEYTVLDHTDSSKVYSAGLDTSLITENNEIIAVSCGSISDIIHSCAYCRAGGEDIPLTEDIKKQIFTECAKLEFIGAKIIACAAKKSPYGTLNRLGVIICEMTFVGFFGIAESSEKSISESIRKITDAGIIPIIFSSMPEHTLYYCHDIGLTGKKTKLVPYNEITEDTMNSLDRYGMIVTFPDGMTAKNKAEAMKAVSAKGRITAAAGREMSDADVLKSADIGLSSSLSAYRPIPEVLSRETDAVISSKTVGKGGFGGIASAIEISSNAIHGIRSAAFYLTASQTARLVVILSAILFGLPMPGAVVILAWGLLYDFTSVLVTAFRTETGAADREKHNEAGALPMTIWKTAVSGVLWGVLCIFLPKAVQLLLSVFGGSLTYRQFSPLIGGALILCALVASLESMKKDSLFKDIRLTPASTLFILLSASAAFLIPCTSFGAGMVNGIPCGFSSLFILFPPLILLASWESVKAIRRKSSIRML